MAATITSPVDARAGTAPRPILAAAIATTAASKPVNLRFTRISLHCGRSTAARAFGRPRTALLR
jgi:hypothetical protein